MESDFFPPFLRNENFPQLCDGVSLKYDSKRGRHIVATRDIPCGEVVCLDTGKVVNLVDGLCCYCLSSLPENHNNRYCDDCVGQDRLYGPFEQPFIDRLQDLGMFRLAVHLALSYPSEDIRAFVKAEGLQRDTNIIAMESSSLAAALSLQIDACPVDLSSTDDLVKDLVSRLDKHPYWGMIPGARRFSAFTTVLRSVSSRLMTNAHTIYFVDQLERRTQDTHCENFIPSGVGLFPVASWFNHSCRANLNSFFYRNKLIFVSAGIRRGEENFLAGRGFTCHCSVCLTTDSIGDMLEPVVEHPDSIVESFKSVDDYRKYRSAFPEGHKMIETIAEMYIGSVNDPKQRLFLYGEIIECQRRRGLHFSPDQSR
ncbi:hypothetical protein COOONC_04293 [Cooperia oncophora]